jgi:ABC-type branched-subunit amino acid transport system permease subunit
MSTESLRDRLGGFVPASLRENDLALIGGVLLAIYLLFVLFSWLLGNDLNGTINTLQRVTFLIAVYAMLALALNLHWGYAGMFNIGVAGFMAIGVYTLGMLTQAPTATPPGLGLPLWVGVVGGVLAAGLVGAIAALPALRLDADYFAIVTVGLSEIIRLTFKSQAFGEFTVAGVTLGTGGANGIGLPANPIQALYYVGGDPANGTTGIGGTILSLADSVGIEPSVAINVTYALLLAVVFVPLFYVLLVRIGNSPFGRVLKAIREDEIVAGSLGKDTARFKIIAFAVGCGLMGLAAILWYTPRGFVNPIRKTFGPIITFYVFIALIVGGAGSNTGSVIGGAVFAALLFQGPLTVASIVGEYIPTTGVPGSFVDAVAALVSLDGFAFLAYTVQNVSSLRYVLVGVVLVYIVQNRPEGLLGHRKEPAATIDLMERDAPPEGRATADGSGAINEGGEAGSGTPPGGGDDE